MPPYYASLLCYPGIPPCVHLLYHPGYTTVCTVLADDATLVVTMRGDGALGSEGRKPMGEASLLP